MPITFTEQRITDRTLEKIQYHVRSLFKSLGIKRKPIEIKFGNGKFLANANYYELANKSLSCAYTLRDNLSSPTKKVVPPLDLNKVTGLDVDANENQGYLGLLGFSYLAEVDEVTCPAVFLNGDFGTAKDGTHGVACHILIHEMIHMHSHRNLGFQSFGYFLGWGKFDRRVGGAEAAGKVYEVLDEGMTEFFARIVSHQLATDDSLPLKQKPTYPLDFEIPIYEYPLRVACDLVKKYGLPMMAKAYFEGDPGLRNKLAQDVKSKKISGAYLKAIADLGITNEKFGVPPTQDGQEVRTLTRSTKSRLRLKARELEVFDEFTGLMLSPVALIGTLDDKTYEDPAWEIWQTPGSRDPKPNPKNRALKIGLIIIGGLTLIGLAYYAYKQVKR